jgi:hypothetical protein
MASRRPFRFLAVACAGLLAYALAGAGLLHAEPDENAKKGSLYRNKEMGVTAQGPAGWRMVADKGVMPTKWQRLVTFNDGRTDAQVVLSVRNRTSARLDDLLDDVRAAWDRTSDKLPVSSMRKIPATPLNPIGTVVVDAAFVQKAPTPKVKPGDPRPPPMPPTRYRVQATYYLGPDHEFLLYATGQQVHWGRLRAPLEQMRASVKLQGAEDEGPKGAGSYRNDLHGFSCAFPVHYTVVAPQRENHLVQFSGVGQGDPVLSVYAYRWSESLERDAERLIEYYEEEKGGEASMKREEFAGREAVVVTARAGDRTIMLALFKRGGDLYRLRASMPEGTEAKGEPVFRRFVAGFKLRSARK